MARNWRWARVSAPSQPRVERAPGDRPGERVEGEGARALAVEVARQLVEQQHGGERGRGSSRTPATGDPAQQRIMLFMPLIFMTMFIWAPSGLVLYWTVSNLWAIGQQVITNRLIGPAPQRVVRPPAERRLKNAGGGKSEAAKERK